jgi:hypothetical protein
VKPTPSVSPALQSRLAANDHAQARREQLFAQFERLHAEHTAGVAALVAQTAELAEQSGRAAAEQEAELERVFGVAN